MTTWNELKVFLAVLLLAVLLGNCLSEPQPQLSYAVDEKISRRMIFIDLTPKEEQSIRDAMSSLFTKRCTQEFIDVGLLSPYEVMMESGVIFESSNDLYIYTAAELGLRSEQIRKMYALEFSSGRAQAGTVHTTLYGLRLTLDGRPRVFLHNTAFLGESVFFGTASLRDVLIHEFIHIGGQPPKPGWFGPLQHDLAGFKHYGRIMAACR